MRIIPLLLSIFFCFTTLFISAAPVQPGVERLFTPSNEEILRGASVGLIVNHTAIDSQGRSTIDLFKQHRQRLGYRLVALFAPEHGISGNYHAAKDVAHEVDEDGIPVLSLHGATRRPTPDMLKGISLLVFDIQDIGCRSYTYASTLCYAMEEAAKANIPVIVLDRPNPLGSVIDGPMLEEKWRSFIGYVNVPYCHGLTIGELAKYYNGEYKIGCKLTVIPMEGWKRQMTFKETGLPWVPTSPQIPDAETALFYPMTGLIGELQLVNIGVGYTLPFRVVGAPWIDAKVFAKQLNEQKLPGVRFHPFHYTPFFGALSGKPCQGVLIYVTDPAVYLPVATGYTLLGILKALYPSQFASGMKRQSHSCLDLFHKANGTQEVHRILLNEKYVTWKLRSLHQTEREAYLQRRKPYLNPAYW